MATENLLDNLSVLLLKYWQLTLFVTTILVLYYYGTAPYNFFKKKGVAFIKPTLFIGNLGPLLTLKTSFHEHHQYIYNYFKGEPYGGSFEGRKPILYLFDLDLIKAVTTRDFDHFVDRLSPKENVPRYIKRTLLFLKGSEWKAVRRTITPVYSSARLKNMMPLLELCSKQSAESFKKYDRREVELKLTMGRHTLGVIGAVAFGIKYEGLTDEKSHFIEMAENFDYVPTYKVIIGTLLNVQFWESKYRDALIKMLQTTKAERRSTDSKENDFLQQLLNVAKIEQSGTEKTKKKCIDEDTIDAQCILFLLAGYDTTNTLLSFTVHVLATKPELQDKLRAHIMEVTEGKELTYEGLKDLDYLDAVLLESLRMYPPTARINRVVTKPYTLPGSDVQLDVGDVIGISIIGIHMDPKYYPEPHEFRPERFMGEEKRTRPLYSFLAFGAGPRHCIASRFAMISAKITLFHLIKNFKFIKCARTQDPITFKKGYHLLLKPEFDMWVRVEKL